MSGSTLLRAAHVFGISSSFFLSAFSFSASYYTLPALAHAPMPARVKGWLEVYDLGKLVSPTLGVSSGLVWSYLAYTSYLRQAGVGAYWQGYAAAGFLTFAVLPWTIVALMPSNKALSRAAKQFHVDGDDAISKQQYPELERQLARWGELNWVRTVTPMVGGVIGVLAALP